MSITSERRKRFTGQMQAHIDSVAGLPPDPYETGCYQKLLFVCILDTLARAVYVDSQSSGKRFVRFIKQFSSWSDHSRVSLPHLVDLLERERFPQLDNVRTFARRELEKWRWGEEIVPISRDPDASMISGIWPSESQAPQKWEWLQHSQLLASYRHSLVHEFRSPSNAEPVQLPAEQPVYVSSGAGHDYDPEKLSRTWWSLSYPVPFFRSLCSTSLELVSQHLLERSKDPYDSFPESDYWR